MEAKDFRLRIIIVTGLMLAFVWGFPSVLAFVQTEARCGSGVGLCSKTIGLWRLFHPQIAAILFAIVIAKLSFTRCGNAQISRLWVVPLTLWILGSSSYLIGFRNLWEMWVTSFGQSLGAGLLSFTPPMLLIYSLAFILFLSFYQKPAPCLEDPSGTQSAWILLWLAAAIGTILKLNIIALSFPILPVIGLPISMAMGSIWATFVISLTWIPWFHLSLLWILPMLFCSVLTYVVIQARKAPTS